MTTGVIVGSILLAANQELGVEERAVAAGADLIDGGRVEIDKDGSGHVFAAAGLAEEGLVGAWVANVLDVGVRATIRAKAVLKEVARLASQLQKLCVRWRGGEPTAPKHCYPAGYQPDPGGDEGPSCDRVNIMNCENGSS